MTLQPGTRARLRATVRRLDGGRVPSGGGVSDGGTVLVGGSPVTCLRLSARAAAVLDDLQVRDPVSEIVLRRLVDANLADPDVGQFRVDAGELTVVVPARDRPDQLARALAALVADGRPGQLLVVDDASRSPGPVAAVADRYAARLIRLRRNVGPAGARNAGLAQVQTPFVAFVDSDVSVSTPALLRLARHLAADPRLALVGPLVRGRSRSPRPRWFERYDEGCSSLSMGPSAGLVREGAQVRWLPAACLVGRVTHVGNGFDEELRIAEDVDLVWRLTDAGHPVRYDPSVVAEHDTRPTMGAWLGRSFAYGTGGAALAARHGDRVAPAVLSPSLALAAGSLLLRRRWSPLVAAVCLGRTWQQVGAALPRTPQGRRLAGRLALRSLGTAVRQESSLVLRHWWPIAAVACLASRTARRVVVSAWLVDVVDQVISSERAQLGLAVGMVGRGLDDLAYGAGLWWGVVRGRSARALRPRLVTGDRARPAPSHGPR